MKRITKFWLIILVLTLPLSSVSQKQFSTEEFEDKAKSPDSNKQMQLNNETVQNGDKISKPSQDPADWLFDLQFEYPLVNIPGEYNYVIGIETDGQYIYLTCLADDYNPIFDTIFRYNLNGTFHSYFIIQGVGNLGDLAYDGTYFYGSNRTTTVWQMDFSIGSESLVSTIVAPTEVTAIGYDDDNNYLIGCKRSHMVTIFDMTGSHISTFVVLNAPAAGHGPFITGLAYDNYTTNGNDSTFVWIYVMSPENEHLLQKYNYPEGFEKIYSINVSTLSTFWTCPDYTGGLAIAPPSTFVVDEPTILGCMRNRSIWGIELNNINPCQTPIHINATDITQTSLDLEWQQGTNTTWDIEFGPAGFNPTGTPTHAGVTSLPFTVTGLSVCTTYDFYLRTDCGGGSYGSWTDPYTFTTAGDCYWNLTAIDPSVYECLWKGNLLDIYVNGNLAHSYGFHNYWVDSFPIQEGSILDFVWNPSIHNNSGRFTINDNFNMAQFSQGPYPITVTGIVGSCIECPSPSGLNVLAVSTTTAHIHWNSEGTESMWNLQYGPFGFTLGTGTIIENVIDQNTSLPGVQYTLTDINPSTVYEWYVQTHCPSIGKISNWIGPDTILTWCGSQVLFPMTETFTYWPPHCWNITGGNWFWEQYNEGTISSKPSALARLPELQYGDAIMTSNTIDVSSLTEPVLSFFWANLKSYSNDTLTVYITDDWGNNWDEVWKKGMVSLNCLSFIYDNPCFERSDYIDLSSFGSNIAIRFHFNKDTVGNKAYLWIDDIRVGNMPPCSPPYGMKISDISGSNNFKLTWTSNSGESEIEWGLEGFSQGSGTLLTNLNSTAIISFLPDIVYHIYYRDVCTNDIKSPWVGPISFRYNVLSIRALLEGPYESSGIMSTNLNETGYIPLDQPYNPSLPYFNNPSPDWLYFGNDSSIYLPGDVVDWIIVQVYDADNVQNTESSDIKATQTALLLKDGSVVGLDGLPLRFINLEIEDGLFLRIYHRNHLSIISSFPLIAIDGIYTYDFTTAEINVYGGIYNHKELEPGYWGMIAGDGNADRQIALNDKTDVWDTLAGEKGYQAADYNMDGEVNNVDKNHIWHINTYFENLFFICGDTLLDPRDQKKYSTVQIGSQCWMAENLNVGIRIDASDEQMNNFIYEKYCYDDLETNCDTYGGLYQWDEMMKYVTTEGVQGICPPGWHIPRDEECKQLEGEVDSNFGYPDPEWNGTDWRGFNVGLNLKSDSLWASNGNGNDLYGFNALPAGKSDNTFPYFSSLTYNAYFYASTETGSWECWRRRLSSSENGIHRDERGQSSGYSVRCVKDFPNQPPIQPNNPFPEDGSMNVEIDIILSWACDDPDGNLSYYKIYLGTDPLPPFDTSGVSESLYEPGLLNYNTSYYWKVVAFDSYGDSAISNIWNFTTEIEPVWTTCGDIYFDNRDGKSYNTVQIGNQCWMKENINIGIRMSGDIDQINNDTIEKYCYDDLESNCDTYGGLYQWDEMMDYVTTEGVKGICPPEWHIPTDEEWKQLEGEVDSNFGYPDPEWDDTGWRGSDAGLNLKSSSLWSSGNGTDLYGFSALPAGRTDDNPPYFTGINYGAYFHTSTEVNLSEFWRRKLDSNYNRIRRNESDKSSGHSVRCIKD